MRIYDEHMDVESFHSQSFRFAEKLSEKDGGDIPDEEDTLPLAGMFD